MSTFTTYEVTDPSATAGPDFDALEAYVDLTRFEALDTVGHLDFVESHNTVALSLLEQKYSLKRLFLLKRKDEFAGYLLFRAPLKDNTHMAYVDIVAYENDKDTLAFAYQLADRCAVEANRSSLQSWSLQSNEPAPEHPHYVGAPTGVGGMDSSECVAASFLAAGWKLEQTERYSVLELPAPTQLIRDLHVKAAAKASETYQLVHWLDHTPDQFVTGHCELMQAMSTDVPSGGLDIQETNYDADRLRTLEEALQKSGKRYSTVAAVHKETGVLAGFTRIEWSSETPESAYQEETLVRKGHRGFALGLWMKSEQLIRLSQTNPSLQRIHTWNAGENDHMLAINVALGFQKRGVEGAWQKKLA